MLAVAAAWASSVVEVGAYEGGGSVAIRASMAPGGKLTVVDPYPRGRLGFSAPLVTARRLARRQPHVRTCWIRAPSLEAARLWEGDLDVVVIDGVHTLEAVCKDWWAWGGFVRSGGVLVVRNDVVIGIGGPAKERSSQLLAAAAEVGTWEILEIGDSFTAFRRR